MGTYGTATGLVLVVPAAGEPGKLLGLLNGELQAYFDSDGKIKWGGGEGVLDEEGVKLPMGDFASWPPTTSRVYMLRDATCGNISGGLSGHVFYDEYGIPKENNFAITLFANADSGGPYPNDSPIIVKLYAYSAGTGSATFELNADGTAYLSTLLMMANKRITNLADATAAMDALNRQTGDARYAPIAGAHAAVTLAADADTLLSLTGQALGLDVQNANKVFAGPASGVDADPTFRVLVADDLPAATESAQGAAELATVGEAAAGTDTGRVPTPAGLPLRVVGSGWALKQTDGSAPGGNARGAAAVDLQAARSADTQVASGAYAVVGGGNQNVASAEYSTVGGGISNQATGYRSTVVGGDGNVASGTNSVAMGKMASASVRGQLAHAAQSFSSTPGLAQRSAYVLAGTTINATPTVIYPDDVGEFMVTIADDTVWNFRAEIAAMTADAAKYAAYTVTGLLRRANGTVTVHGVATTTIAESDAGWDATAEADDTNKALSIKVTGAAATTIRWVASVYTSEVTFAGA